MPFLLWITYRYYQDNIRLFMYYGIVSALFSFAYSNPPLSAIINISSLFVVYLISYYHNGKLAPMEFIGKYSLVLFSFVLFNSWWLLNLFNIVDDALKIYSVPFATAWLEQTVAYATAPIAKSLSLTHITPAAEWDFLGAHYHSFPLILVTYIIFFINDKSHAKFNLHLLAVVLLMIFLTKGSSRPFGEVYVFLFKNIPFFNNNNYMAGTLLIPPLASLFILPMWINLFPIGVPVSCILGWLTGTFAGGYYVRSSEGISSL